MKLFKKKEPKFQGCDIAPHEIPSIRIATALANQCANKIAFVVGGGLGDRICTEPTLRFAFDVFQGVELSLICETPQLFKHLPFKEVYDLKNTHPIVGRHLYLHTYSRSPLYNQFMCPNLVHSIDVPSLSAYRAQIPVSYKSVCIPTPEINSSIPELSQLYRSEFVLVHLGKSWPSRTFPSSWWDGILIELKKKGRTPVLIGNDCVTVSEVDGCLDLTNKLNLDEFLYSCLTCHAMVTNDSSPLHIAAAGMAKIGFVSTCRRGDLITHYRASTTEWPEYGWGMRDFAKNQMWLRYNIVPNNLDILSMKEVPKGKIEDYSPEPEEVVEWI